MAGLSSLFQSFKVINAWVRGAPKRLSMLYYQPFGKKSRDIY